VLRRLLRGKASASTCLSHWTTHLLFEPAKFLEKLAALTPQPAINLILYHGVLASHARWRPDMLAYGRPERDAASGRWRAPGPGDNEDRSVARPRHRTWAALMRRAFDLDVLRCPRCAGRMELTATIEDPPSLHRSSRISRCLEHATPCTRGRCVFSARRPAYASVRRTLTVSSAARHRRPSSS